MSGINTGILTNAFPLTAEQIKAVENDVLEKEEAVVFLDEHKKLCYAIPFNPELIKKLAWHDAFEIYTNGNILIKKNYKKQSLDSFYLHNILAKHSINEPWSNIILPSEYQQLEYIENTGTQYIDTGVVPTANLCVDIVYQSMNTEGSQYIAGARGKEIDYAINGSIMRSDWDIRFDANAIYSNITRTSDKIQTVINMTNGNGSWTLKNLNTGNSHIFTFSNKTVTTYTTFGLFCYNAEEPYIHTNLRIFGCKLYTQKQLIRDFIPCYRKLDGATGLFDLVTNSFYINNGTGSFKKGPAKIPVEYQLLDYIESTGTQYIDTGLIGKPGYTIDTTISFKELSTGSYQYFAGYSYTGSADRIYYIRVNNDTDHLGYTFGSNVRQLYVIEPETFYNITSVMKTNHQELLINDTSVGSSSHGALSYDEENPVHIYMFASQYPNSGINGITKIKCKETKWFDENGVLVRDFVPCYRKSDDVVGLYDVVESKFYTNSGTGVFLKGNSI